MDAETKSGFMIDGRLYEVPSIDSFTMDEAQVLYDYSGLTLEDFVQAEDETEAETEERTRRLKNPGFLRALMHVAYQRGNPKLQPNLVRSLVGEANVITALEHLGGAEEDADPLALTNEPSEQSSNGLDEQNAPSGIASPRSSAQLAKDQPRTGITGSVTSSTLGRNTSAA